MAFPENLHLFCRVIDNFGDIGICWRLARQLANEYSIRTTLWVDDLASLAKICPAFDLRRDEQQIHNVVVKRWRDTVETVDLLDVADVVIEAFACDLPSAYMAAMAARVRKPIWINLEYLSAEPWVEGCHAIASPHPFLPLMKHFFFPGFTDRTGGLLAERDLSARRIAFQSDSAARAHFFTALGIDVPHATRKVSLFCYPAAPVSSLFNALSMDVQPTICLVPEGVASDAVSAFCRQPAQAGASATRGALTIQVLPFVDQSDYDKLLWACDLNFVRGEDSFVRAQWAARPFIWHIYPQEEDAHWKKLHAFIDHYTKAMPLEARQIVIKVWEAWNSGNRVGNMGVYWNALQLMMPLLQQNADNWTQWLAKKKDLAGNLVRYVREIG